VWRDDAVITIATYLERHVRWMAQTPDLTNHSAFVSPGWGFLLALCTSVLHFMGWVGRCLGRGPFVDDTRSRQLLEGWLTVLNRAVIPRTLHQIWLGPRPAPLNWTESWRTKNPEFEYLMWGQHEIAEFELRNAALFDRFVSEGIFDGAADVARAEIVHRLGGIYADADSLALRPLRGAPFLEAEFFAVAEPGDKLISNAFMGAAPKHPIVERYVAAIAGVVELKPMWRLTGPGALTAVVDNFGRDGVVILPAWTFFSTTLDGADVSGGDGYARHFWSTTAERWGRSGTTPYPMKPV